MPKRVVTIDIDSITIRVLEAQGDHVSRWASAAINPGTEEGDVSASEALGIQVRELMDAAGIKGGRVIVSLSGLYSVCRLMTFESPSDGARSLPQQVRDAVPGDEMRLQYQMVEDEADSGQRALVLGCPNATIDAQLAVIRSAGLAYQVLEIKGLALSRIVDRSQALIVNMEQATVDVVLVADGIPQMARTLSIPADYAPEDLGGFVATVLEQTVDFWESQNPLKEFAEEVPLFLVGAGMTDPSIREALQSLVSNPLEQVTPAVECPPGLPVDEYAVNLGLAMREVSGDGRYDGVIPLHINVAPPRVSRWRISTWMAAALAVLAIAVAGITLLYGQVSDARDETEAIQGQLTPMQAQVTVRQGELAKIDEIESTLKESRSLTAPWGRITAVVQLIQDSLTEGITVTSYNISGSQVSNSAAAATVGDALDFVEALRADGRFTVPFSAPTTDLTVTFDLSALQAE